MAIDDISKQVSTSSSEVRFLTQIDIDTKSQQRYCRFKRHGIKHVDYKYHEFLFKF